MIYRREPLEVRKATLASLLAKVGPGIRFNEHLDYDDGAAVFHHACKMGLEGIVSKRKDSPYRSGRSPDWLKMKNPACEAVKREAEEDWGKERRRRRQRTEFMNYGPKDDVFTWSSSGQDGCCQTMPSSVPRAEVDCRRSETRIRIDPAHEGRLVPGFSEPSCCDFFQMTRHH